MICYIVWLKLLLVACGEKYISLSAASDLHPAVAAAAQINCKVFGKVQGWSKGLSADTHGGCIHNRVKQYCQDLTRPCRLQKYTSGNYFKVLKSRGLPHELLTLTEQKMRGKTWNMGTPWNTETAKQKTRPAGQITTSLFRTITRAPDIILSQCQLLWGPVLNQDWPLSPWQQQNKRSRVRFLSSERKSFLATKITRSGNSRILRLKLNAVPVKDPAPQLPVVCWSDWETLTEHVSANAHRWLAWLVFG